MSPLGRALRPTAAFFWSLLHRCKRNSPPQRRTPCFVLRVVPPAGGLLSREGKQLRRHKVRFTRNGLTAISRPLPCASFPTVTRCSGLTIWCQCRACGPGPRGVLLIPWHMQSARYPLERCLTVIAAALLNDLFRYFRKIRCACVPEHTPWGDGGRLIAAPAKAAGGTGDALDSVLPSRKKVKPVRHRRMGKVLGRCAVVRITFPACFPSVGAHSVRP